MVRVYNVRQRCMLGVYLAMLVPVLPLLALLVLCCLSQAQRTYDLVLEKLVKVMVDPQYMDAGTLRVTRINRTHTVVAGDFETKEEITNEMLVTILTYEQLGTEYKRSVGVAVKDKPLCEFLESKMLGIDSFRNTTNLPDKCPIPPGKYHINNFVLDPERFPAHIPGKKWRGDILISLDDITLAHIQIYLHIDRDRAAAKLFG